VFSNCAAVENALVDSAKRSSHLKTKLKTFRTGERVWPMPMYPEYEELIKSDIADVASSPHTL
jgi:leucyl aminopeptidase